MNDCVFCKIVRGEIPSKKLYEDDDFLIFDNINPKTKIHYLAIPKIHFATLAEMNEDEAILVGKLLKLIPSLSKQLNIENGYRFVINQKGNTGNDAHQEVMHLHIHILAGEDLSE